MMKQRPWKTLLILAAGVILLAACSNDPRKSIVGEWRSLDGSRQIEFFDDGTAHLDSPEVSVDFEYSFVEDRQFRVQSDVSEQVWEIESTNERLRITATDGREYIKIEQIDLRYARRVLPDLLDGLRVTISATFIGFALALAFGFAFALGRRSESPWVSIPVSALVEFTRGTPLLVQLFLFFFVLPRYGLRLPTVDLGFVELSQGFQLGVIVLGLHYGTYCSEVYRAGIDAVPTGQWEAATALNFTPRRVWAGIILPQAIPPMIPAFGNYFVAMFKETAQLAAIAVLELLTAARIAGTDSFRFLEPITMAGALYFAVSYPSSLIVQQLERRFGRPTRQ